MNEEKLKDALGEIVERLAPGIGPYDRREAVDQILTAVHWWRDTSGAYVEVED